MWAEPGYSPGVLVVEAERDLVDGVRVRHHHIEAVLRENRMWSSELCLTHTSCLNQGRCRYLVVHDRTQAHDAHVHVVLLAHQP